MIDKAILTLPHFKKILAKLAGISFLQAFSVVFQAIFLARAIVIFWQGKPFNSGASSILFFFLAFILRHLCTFWRERILDYYAYQQVAHIRKSLMQKIFSQGTLLVQNTGSGSLITNVLEGVNQVENYIRLVSSKMLNMLIFPTIIFLAVFMQDKLSAFILFAVFPVIILFMVLLGVAARKKAQRQFASFQLLSNHFLDSLRGLETLKLFGLSKSYAKSIYKTSERLRRATMNTLKVAMLSTFALDFFTTLSVAIVAVFLGLRLLNGEIEFLPALITLILAPEFFLALREFAGDYHATLDGKNALKAINQLLGIPEVEQKEVLADFTYNETSMFDISSLHFSYPDSSGKISDFQFSWQGYGKIGIIGKSGAGKSTLISLLGGFLQPNKSEISINGQQIPHFTQKNWQQKISYIPQKTYIFHGTLKENVCLYAPNASDEQIAKALKASGLTSLVQEIGLNEIVGQGARQLSGGQAQRIALARAFLSEKRNILLLDEPTAHLDIETQAQVIQEMLPLLENKLVFLATHRLHWMPSMDYILVVEKGKIVACGTHEELLANSLSYQQFIHERR
ncbi:MAG: thiol reductant ABC exporter subunit CydD [Streptococcaceae bacterium]|nr:thiol reductant ABC exporter subunit CydD [Streptococcaceae bacterium]